MSCTRLSQRQQEALEYALDEAELPEGSRVYLFGSRTDPDASGGDVDLLVYAPGLDSYDLEKAIRLAYKRKLDERIDVIVIDPDHPVPAIAAFAATVTKERVR